MVYLISLATRCWNGALFFGDIFGKLAAFIGIPSVIIASVLYWNEIWDQFTAPDFTVGIETVEIRCGVILESDDKIKVAKTSFGKVCAEAPLAVSFEMSAHNEDSITRTLIDMSIVLNSKLLDREIVLPVTHIVSESITNYVKSTFLVPWENQTFDKGQNRRMEIQFSPTLIESKLEFSEFRDQFNKDPAGVTNSVMTIEIYAKFVGVDDSIQLSKCQILFEHNSVQRFIKKALDEQVAYVRRCETTAS
jgi:hypothetical protein